MPTDCGMARWCFLALGYANAICHRFGVCRGVGCTEGVQAPNFRSAHDCSLSVGAICFTSAFIFALHASRYGLWETYARPGVTQPNGKLGTVDCTHHIITPLYYDALFMRLARLLRSWKSSGLSEHDVRVPPRARHAIRRIL
jgi:hypothetical protein